MAQTELDSNRVVQMLTKVSGDFDTGKLNPIYARVLVATLNPRTGSYSVRDMDSFDGTLDASRQVFHQGVANFYIRAAEDSGQARSLQAHMSRIDHALDSDFAVPQELDGEHIWFHKTPDNIPLELSSSIRLERGTVGSVIWAVAYSRVTRMMTTDMLAEQASGRLI